MNKFNQNIVNTFGEKGRIWLSNLPHITSELAICWNLSDITPVNNMTFNYVAKAITSENLPVVIKICCDVKSILDEIQALEYFDGNGSIRLIAYNEKHHALLMQQAMPGITLKSLYSSKMEYVMDCYINTMQKLHSKPLPNKTNYHHIRDWLTAIDNLTEAHCPVSLINKAIDLKEKLLKTMTREVFLHGDLHHDNILKDGEHWLAIDPKGIIGEPEFEIAAFDFMYVNELANMNTVKNNFETRIHLLAQKSQLNLQRMKDWVFVRLILMAAWHVEDNSDSSFAIKLAKQLFE